jgi:hypothetical protein
MATFEDTAFATYATGDNVDVFKKVFDGLVSVGVTQTTDTGQLDLTTAPAAVFSNSGYNYGYTVHKIEDSLFSTYPLYLKIDYRNVGVSNASAMAPKFIFTVGTGTNGSGTITGTTQTVGIVGNQLQADRVLRRIVISFSENGLFLVAGEGSNSYNEVQLGVSRLVDENGNKTIGNFVIEHNYRANSGGSDNMDMIVIQEGKASATTTLFSNTSHPRVNTWGTSMIINGDIPVYPTYIPVPEYRTTTHSILTNSTPSIGDIFTVNRLNKTYTYRALSGIYRPNTTWTRNAMIWE